MERLFGSLVSEAAADGRGVLLSSHILAEVDRLCDYVTIIKDGRQVESAPLSALRHLSATTIRVGSPPPGSSTTSRRSASPSESVSTPPMLEVGWSSPARRGPHVLGVLSARGVTDDLHPREPGRTVLAALRDGRDMTVLATPSTTLGSDLRTRPAAALDGSPVPAAVGLLAGADHRPRRRHRAELQRAPIPTSPHAPPSSTACGATPPKSCTDSSRCLAPSANWRNGRWAPT